MSSFFLGAERPRQHDVTNARGARPGLADSQKISRKGTDFSGFFPKEASYRMISQLMNSEGTAQNPYSHHE